MTGISITCLVTLYCTFGMLLSSVLIPVVSTALRNWGAQWLRKSGL